MQVAIQHFLEMQMQSFKSIEICVKVYIYISVQNSIFKKYERQKNIF